MSKKTFVPGRKLGGRRIFLWRKNGKAKNKDTTGYSNRGREQEISCEQVSSPSTSQSCCSIISSDPFFRVSHLQLFLITTTKQTSQNPNNPSIKLYLSCQHKNQIMLFRRNHTPHSNPKPPLYYPTTTLFINSSQTKLKNPILLPKKPTFFNGTQ